MKLQISTRPQQGSTLGMVLIFTILLGVLLAAFLTLLNHSRRLTARAQLWNLAVPVSEAGIEEALTHLNVNGGSTNLARDGWQKVSGANVYWVQRAMAGNHYLVTISNWIPNIQTNAPTLESRAYIRNTLAALPTPYFAAAGGNAPPPAHLTRGIRVVTGQKTVISKGLVSKGSLQFQSGGTIVGDSYDSTDPTQSNNGRYDSSKASDKVYVGTNSRVSGNMQLQGNLKIAGMIGTGATGVLSIQSPASVGNYAWINNSANNGKVKPGHLDTSLNIPFPTVPVPFTSGFFTPASGSYGGTNYTVLLNIANGKYRKTGNIELMDSGKVLLATEDVTLYVTDSLKLDNGQIIVAPGKRLTVYVEKAFEAKGNARINEFGVPSQFFYYGRPQNTSFQVMDTVDMVGVFYAPTADGQLKDNSELHGGGTFGSLQLQHNFKFHYDKALGSSSERLFFVSSWNEMSPQDVKNTPTGVPLQLP